MKMPTKTFLPLAALGVALAAGPAAAQQKVDATRSASADALVEIENPAGSVRVIGWDRGEVHVTGDLGSGASGLDTERNPHGVHSALEIHVPTRARVQVESFAGSITIADVGGTVSAETVNG